MSGIFGLWNLDGRPVEPELLAKMSATLAHRGPDGEGQWIDGPVGLGCQLMRVTPESLTETQPLVSPSGAVAVFEGRLDNREELLGLLKGAWGAEPDSPDPALVLALYDKYGDRFPEYLNGDFALAVFDPKRQQLLLARDAIGLRTLYYHQSGNAWLFATEIKAILAHPQVTARPHDGVIAEFMTRSVFGPNQGETFFAGVFGVMPGHLFLVHPAGVVNREYWDFDATATLHLPSFQEYAEAFRHYFEQAVRRRLRSAYPVAVSLSGGVDSSAIFCLAQTLKGQSPQNFPPVLGLSFTFPEGSPADEKKYLKEIEQRYGVQIHEIPNDGRLRLTNRVHEEIWHAEGPLLEWAAMHQLEEGVGRLNARTIVSGIGGDETLFDYTYLIDLFHRLEWRRFKEHLSGYHHWVDGVGPGYFRQCFLRELITHHIPKDLYACLRRIRAQWFPAALSGWDLKWLSDRIREQGLRRILRKTPYPAKNNRRFATASAKSLYNNLKDQYTIIRLEWFQKMAAMHGQEYVLPYLDRDLFAFLMATPGEMISFNGVPKGILRYALRGILPEAIAQRRSKADFTDAGNEGMEQDYPRLAQQWRTGGLAARFGYINEGSLKEELARQMQGLGQHTHDAMRNLLSLLGMELWLQVFYTKP